MRTHDSYQQSFTVYLVLFVFISLFISTIAKAGDLKNAGPDYGVTLRTMKQVLPLVRKETPVAIVTFVTDTFEGPKILDGVFSKEKALWSASSFSLTEKNQQALRIKGVFALEKSLSLSPPMVGRVDEEIILKQDSGVPTRDEIRQRLRPLIPFTINDKKVPMRYLAIWPSEVEHILEGAFFGPIAERQVKDITEIAEFLKKEIKKKVTREIIEKLLDSPNSWMVYLAIVRLEEMNALSPKHFIQAVNSLPVENVADATDELLSMAYLNGAMEKETTAELCKVLGKLPSGKEKSLLAILNNRFRQNPQNVLRIVNLPELQATAQTYRAKILNDLDRADVVRELDALIAFKAKTNN